MSPRSYALFALVLATTVLAALGYRTAGGVSFAVGLVGYLAWGQLRYRLALRRVGQARARFDGAALRREVDRLARYVNEVSSLFQQLKLERALSFMMDERFQEADEELSSVVMDRLPERAKLSVLGNRAYCHARMGLAAQAIAEATESAHRAEPLGPELHAVHLGILGAAYVHAGEGEKALPLLQRALAQADPHPHLRVMREVYLGDALRLLGRADEARAAYERARTVAPESTFARQAAQRLAEAR